LQKAIREEHVNNFLAPLYMSDVIPSPDEKRLACAAHLHRRFNFPGGVEEAKAKLDTVFLTPKVRNKNEEQQYRPEKLYKVLRQAWPRFQRDLEMVMVPAFMVQAGRWLQIGSRGRVNGRNNMPIFSRDEAKKTIQGYWMFETAMGRNSVLAGLHAGFQRLHALGIVMVDPTATTDRHYKVTFKTYAALMAMVRSLSSCVSDCVTQLVYCRIVGWVPVTIARVAFMVAPHTLVLPSVRCLLWMCRLFLPECMDRLQMYVAMHKMANYESFTERGGNVDQAFRKVWASFMLLLDDKLPKDTSAHEGLLLTDGNDVTRSEFPGLLPTRLTRTMDLLSRAARLPSPPPSPASAAAAAALAAAAAAVDDDGADDDDEDGDDDADTDDDDDGEEGDPDDGEEGA